MMTPRNRRPHVALLLAGAVFALTAMAGPDLVQHLGGSVRDHHGCPVYHWTHGASTGAPAWASPAPPLPIVSTAAPFGRVAAPDGSTPPPSSRAPPLVA